MNFRHLFPSADTQNSTLRLVFSLPYCISYNLPETSYCNDRTEFINNLQNGRLASIYFACVSIKNGTAATLWNIFMGTGLDFHMDGEIVTLPN